MDYGALPPEVNSLRMYSGPGSGPLLTAASGWGKLAAELGPAITSYEGVIATLHSDDWVGQTSTLMADAVRPYVAWLRTTVAQAEQAAVHLRRAIVAYEEVMAKIVPPPLVAANRAQRELLTVNNVFGQNTDKIMLIEAQYADMWVQDATAMYVYAAAAANASGMTPFALPPRTTNPSAAASQAAAVTQAAATPTGTAQSALAKLISGAPSALLDLARPTSSLTTAAEGAAQPLWVQYLETFLNLVSQLTSSVYNTTGLPYFGIGIANSIASTGKALGDVGPGAAASIAAETAVGAANGGVVALGGSGPIAVSLDSAASVGKLSVPASWPGIAPGLTPAASSASAPLVSEIVEPEVGSGNLLGGMPLAGPGLGAAGSAPRYGFRPKVMVRPPFAG